MQDTNKKIPDEAKSALGNKIKRIIIHFSIGSLDGNSRFVMEARIDVLNKDINSRTTEVKDSSDAVIVSEETIEKIHSTGFVQGMELLINFVSSDDTRMVFIYIRRIE